MKIMNKTYRQLGILIACQALLFANAVTFNTINGLVGAQLASTKALATLPIALYIIGATISTMPVSMYMRRVGRRRGLMTGAVFGVFGTLLATAGATYQSFTILCCGTCIAGIYNACGQYYRFTALELAEHHSPKLRARAVSLVLTGGIAGGIIGPELAKRSRDIGVAPFAATYFILALFCLASLCLLHFLSVNQDIVLSKERFGRPLSEIIRTPEFISAASGAAIGYAAMNLIMTATPLAMGICGLPFGSTVRVMQCHVVAMFLPSFLTGKMINKYGEKNIMLAGCAFALAAVLVNMINPALNGFYVALVILGVAWNFLYVGGTTLLGRLATPEEKGRVQGLNDLIIFLSMISSSFSSGVLISSRGWAMVNYVALFAVIGLFVTLLSQSRRIMVAAGA